MDKSTARLRRLDFIDIVLMKHLLEGVNGESIAKLLNVNPSAISYRKKKISEIFEDFFDKDLATGKLSIAEAGTAISKKMIRALDVFM